MRTYTWTSRPALSAFRGQCHDARITLAVGFSGERPGDQMAKRVIGATVAALCFGGRRTVRCGTPDDDTACRAGASSCADPAANRVGGRCEDGPVGRRVLQRHDASLRRPLRRIARLLRPMKRSPTPVPGRQPAGTGRYCTDVFTDTVVQQTSPTIAPPPTTSVPLVDDHRSIGAAGSADQPRSGKPDTRCGWLLGRRDPGRRCALAPVR